MIVISTFVVSSFIVNAEETTDSSDSELNKYDVLKEYLDVYSEEGLLKDYYYIYFSKSYNGVRRVVLFTSNSEFSATWEDTQFYDIDGELKDTIQSFSTYYKTFGALYDAIYLSGDVTCYLTDYSDSTTSPNLYGSEFSSGATFRGGYIVGIDSDYNSQTEIYSYSFSPCLSNFDLTLTYNNNSITVSGDDNVRLDSSILQNATSLDNQPITSYFDFSYWCNEITLTDTTGSKHDVFFYSKDTPIFTFNDDNTVTVTISDGYMYYKELVKDNGLLYSDEDIPTLDALLPDTFSYEYQFNQKYLNPHWYSIKDYTFIIDYSSSDITDRGSSSRNIDTFSICSPIKLSESRLLSQLTECTRNEKGRTSDITSFGSDIIFKSYMNSCDIDSNGVDLNFHICNSDDIEITTLVPSDVEYEFSALQYNDNSLECIYYFNVDDNTLSGSALIAPSSEKAYLQWFVDTYSENSDGTYNLLLHLQYGISGYIKVINYGSDGSLQPYYVKLPYADTSNNSYGYTDYYMSLKSHFDFYGGFKTLVTNFDSDYNHQTTSDLYNPNNVDFYLNQDGTKNGYNPFYDGYDDDSLNEYLQDNNISSSDDDLSWGDGYNASTGSSNNPLNGSPSLDFDFSDIDSFFNSLASFFDWLAVVFSFMPAWFWSLFSLSCVLIIFLRILGR